jgi:hypothetical protein
MTREELIAKINANPADSKLIGYAAHSARTHSEAQSWRWIIDNGKRPTRSKVLARENLWYWYACEPQDHWQLPWEFYGGAHLEIGGYFATPFEAYEALVAAIVRIGFPDGTPAKQKPNECGREEFSLAAQAAIESMRENEERKEPEPKIVYNITELYPMTFWEWLRTADFSVISRAKERAKKIAGVTAIGLGLVVCTVLCVLVVGAGIIGLLNLITGVKP